MRWANTLQLNQPVARAISYHELASSARASEVAAGDQFLTDTPWANPNHPLNKRAPVLEAHNTRIAVATPPPATQPWMMSSALPSSEARPSGPSTKSDPRRPHAQAPDPLTNGAGRSSPFDALKRQASNRTSEPPASWRDNAQASLASRISHNVTPRVDKSPFETRATKTSASRPIDPSGLSLAQGFATSALHTGAPDKGSSFLANTGITNRAGVFGTPGVEREGSRVPPEKERTEYIALEGVR